MNNSKVRYSAFDTALYYITFKDRTKKEISTKLKEKGYSDLDIEEAILKLKEYGYINEENYAFSYIKSNITKKGSKLISMELMNKGVSNEIIREQLLEFEEREEDVIGNILESRYAETDFSDERALRRVYSYFARKGFRYDSISNALSFYRKNTKKY
ncbi:MAG: regulatory protein RecX [Lachnospiraceae bacterium]|nr:regulatory protein RecX [Lachnospiraceae bacterium]